MIKFLPIFVAMCSSFASLSFAQEIPEKVSGKAVLPAIETQQEYQTALEQALKSAIFNACVAIKGQQWAFDKKRKIEQKLLTRAWDFIAEYRVVGKGEDSSGAWIVVEAQIFWDKLKDALALLELPELPAIMITSDRSLKEAFWFDDFLRGLKYGFSDKGFLVVETPKNVSAVEIALGLVGKNKLKAEVKPFTGDSLFVKELELAGGNEFLPYNSGLALADSLLEHMVREKIVAELYEFVLELFIGGKTYSDIVSFTKQLYLVGAIKVKISEAESGKILFRIVALKPKEEILSKLVSLGFRVSAD